MLLGSSRRSTPLPPLRIALLAQSQACKAKTLDAVVVATDDERIAEACRAAGAQVVMTHPDCANGGRAWCGLRAGQTAASWTAATGAVRATLPLLLLPPLPPLLLRLRLPHRTAAALHMLRSDQQHLACWAAWAAACCHCRSGGCGGGPAALLSLSLATRSCVKPPHPTSPHPQARSGARRRSAS